MVSRCARKSSIETRLDSESKKSAMAAQQAVARCHLICASYGYLAVIVLPCYFNYFLLLQLIGDPKQKKRLDSNVRQ